MSMSKPKEEFPHDDLASPGSTTKVFPQEELAIPEQEEILAPLKRWEPSVLGWKSTVPLCIILVLIGIGLEIVLYFSDRNHGFSWVRVSATEARQFLKSFLAIALFLPVLAWIGSAYIEMKVLQPYLDLARGDASSRNAITTEYSTLGPFKTARKSYARRHLILATASCIMLVTLVFQPLAGSLLSVKPIWIESKNVRMDTAGSLALSSTLAGYPTPYVAAAGFVDATLSSNGFLPSYIYMNYSDATSSQGYTTPAFSVADLASLNSDDGNYLITISTNLLAFKVQCAGATSVNIIQSTETSIDSTWTINASLSPSCVGNFTMPDAVNNWQGVVGRAPLDCITAINSEATNTDNLPEQQWPVMFGFGANQTAASVVFCYAYQQEMSGTATMETFDYDQSYLSDISDLTTIQSSSLEGYCYSGLQQYSSTILSGAAEAIGLALADSVIKYASNDDYAGGNSTLQTQILANSNSALSYVQEVYLIYVMIAANSIFTTGIRTPTTGTLLSEEDRLLAFGPAIHSLTVLCILTSIALAVIFHLHSRQRRLLHLADRPATLGVAAAMLSRSRVSQILHPRDTNKEVERKLAGMKFGIDMKTGALDHV